MEKYRVLNIQGAVLDKHQLENYLEQLASDNILKENSDKDTYPIPRMKENFEIITETYHLLNEHIKLKIPIHPAGEWLLDNYYAIEETVKALEKELTLKKYKKFLGLANGPYAGFARVYVLATEIVAYTDAKINVQNLQDALVAYQRKKTLSMDEIWSMGLFLQIAIIENMRGICEKIYSSGLQKYRVEDIVERLIENKSKDELQFKNIKPYKARVNEYGEMKYPFIEYMSYKLKRYGKKAYPFFMVLEEQVGKMGTNISEIINKEHFDIAVKKVSIGNCITSIKLLRRINFIDIFEQINQVEDILNKDPMNVYSKMDYKTKIDYRNKVKKIAKKTKISEIYIAKKCLELAQNSQSENKKEHHIGYYLVGDGKNKLLEILQSKKVNSLNNNQKMVIYIMTKVVISILITAFLVAYMYKQTQNVIFSLLTGILLYIPIENLIIQTMQYILGKIVKPTFIPKLDFQNGVPENCATFVVIPTIIKSKEKIEELMKKLEVYYLANKSDNVYFALLGDCSQSDKEKEDFDEEVEVSGLKLSQKLNEKYVDTKFPKFSFIYRKRVWNSKEESYLGWERKRGLLCQFNEYILGNIPNPFAVNTIENNKQNLPRIKYVITLDSDTELVLNTGLELIGAMAHILNKPDLNKEKNAVIARTWNHSATRGNKLKRCTKNKIYKTICRGRWNRFIHKCNIRCLSRQF